MSFKVAYLGSKKANNGFMCNFNNFDKKKVFSNMKRHFPQMSRFGDMLSQRRPKTSKRVDTVL